MQVWLVELTTCYGSGHKDIRISFEITYYTLTFGSMLRGDGGLGELH